MRRLCRWEGAWKSKDFGEDMMKNLSNFEWYGDISRKLFFTVSSDVKKKRK